MIFKVKTVNSELISLDLLKTFSTFVEAGGVNGAAQKLKITQASVSLQLQKLEAEMGFPLFVRVGRRKMLTDIAKQLSQDLASPLKLVSQALRENSSKLATKRQTQLKIACPAYLLERTLAELKFEGSMQIRNVNEDLAMKLMKDDKIDVAILSVAPTDGEFKRKILFQQKFFYVWSTTLKRKNKNWSSSKSLAENLSELPMAIDLKVQKKLQEQLKKGQVISKFVCEDPMAVISFVKKDLAWSIVDENLHQMIKSQPGILTSPVPEKLISAETIYLVWHSSRNKPF